MSFVYIIVENGEAHSTAYTNYLSAVRAVKEKHKETLEKQINEVQNLYDIESILSDINVTENIHTGVSQLYIEKGINILILKLVVQ
jgi:hypothetical protein